MGNGVLVGADQVDRLSGSLKGRRFALLTNPTGIDSGFRSTIEVCAGIEGAKLSAFFACEHGLRNELQAGVKFEDHTDEEYGIPVYSLYGKNRVPTAHSLQGLDAVVFDIQDLGVRFYTYLTTLVYAMSACAENGVKLIVLDRPNPLGGHRVEGGLLREGFYSMVGAWEMPVLSGMTIGEFARLVNAQAEKPCELEIIPLQGWRRSMEYSDTGLPWIMPSPNMPTIDTVRIYGGNCLFEGTNLSEGRGTTRPFEMVGAPWLDHKQLCDTLNALELPGVRYHPVTFTPTFQKHAGQLCKGVFTYVTDKTSFLSVESGLTLLHHIVSLHPNEFEWQGSEDGKTFIDILSGSDEVRRRIAQPEGLKEIAASWKRQSQEWGEQRKSYLLYED
ncbi:exo-beta-N-acetylmuramidase NamZ domain-containing protein [Cohnella sp.]|uniref:exo-beta-N-acetylmuramidase NamZ family protein n=1 Tax=Cohnella sp. TaxID=1883426 RepID=UPI003568C8C5